VSVVLLYHCIGSKYLNMRSLLLRSALVLASFHPEWALSFGLQSQPLSARTHIMKGSMILSAKARGSPALAGMPMSPKIFPIDDNHNDNDDAEVTIVIRYMYDGGTLSNGKLCLLSPKNESFVSSHEISSVLCEDGVDLDRFYIAAYETEMSGGGGWMRMPMHTENESRSENGNDKGREWRFPVPRAKSMDEGTSTSHDRSDAPARRIDVKLFRRPQLDDSGNIVTTIDEVDALIAESASKPCGKLPRSQGYFGIGFINGKTEFNVGTLMRSAYQLGAAFIYTVGKRYKIQSSDTVKAHTRIPLFEFEKWESFATFVPRNATLVAIEMGGIPLKDFQHPTNAVYILGSENAGIPKSVVRSCDEVVSLE